MVEKMKKLSRKVKFDVRCVWIISLLLIIFGVCVEVEIFKRGIIECDSRLEASLAIGAMLILAWLITDVAKMLPLIKYIQYDSSKYMKDTNQDSLIDFLTDDNAIEILDSMIYKADDKYLYCFCDVAILDSSFAKAEHEVIKSYYTQIAVIDISSINEMYFIAYDNLVCLCFETDDIVYSITLSPLTRHSKNIDMCETIRSVSGKLLSNLPLRFKYSDTFIEDCSDKEVIKTIQSVTLSNVVNNYNYTMFDKKYFED